MKHRQPVFIFSIFDYVFLGMGEDGHIASLSPGGSPDANAGEKIYSPVVGLKSPFKRITLTYSILQNAQEVWVLASGPGKEVALKESPSIHEQTPLAQAIQVRAKTLVSTGIPTV